MNYITEIPWWHYPLMVVVFSFLIGVMVLCAAVMWILHKHDEIHLIKDEENEKEEIHPEGA